MARVITSGSVSKAGRPALGGCEERSSFHQSPTNTYNETKKESRSSMAPSFGESLVHQHTISTPSPFFAITHQTSQAFSFALQAVRDSFWGGEKPSPTSGPGVSLDRGETHVEEARSLGLEHAPLYGGEHLLAEGSGPG